MSPKWQAFLNSQGGVFSADGSLRFSGSTVPTQNNIITDLSHLAILEITGADAIDFLNGQFTTNIQQLEKYHFQFSAWCNQKGRVKTTFFIYRHTTGFNILLPNELKDSFLKQLQMYIMRSNVQIADKSDELVRIGLQTNDKTLLSGSDIHYLPISNLDDHTQRYIIIGSVNGLIILWKKFSKDNIAVGVDIWKLLDIQTGYPWLSPQLTELFLPQMLNLDLIDGLNYQKGCYLGQEIIVRLYSRGKLKRSLYLATCSLDANIKIADQIYTTDHKKSIGTIINAQAHDDIYYLLAVIEKKWIGNHATFQESNGTTLKLQPLPYQNEDKNN